MKQSTRRRRILCAAVGLLVAAGCSGGRTAAHPRPSALAEPATDSAATAVLQQALVKTRALRSYSFSASQTLAGGPRQQRTLLSGRVIRRPPATSYVLTIGGKVQEIIQVGGRTYRRRPPGPWQRLVKPAAAQDPLATLLVLLGHLQHPRLSGASLTGTIPNAALAEAHLAPAASLVGDGALATVDLSRDGHVTALTVRASVRAGSAPLQLAEKISFSGLDRAAEVRPPVAHR